MDKKNDVIIAGGGLAGLTAAIHLAKAGLKVLVIEKHTYPQHKVCGEYISNEVLPYLHWLGADPSILQPSRINKFQFSSVSGKLITASLPLGGFGLSRYALDQFLMQRAKDYGCEVVQDMVQDISFHHDEFEVNTTCCGVLKALVVIGAYGKRAALDLKLKRAFIQQKSPWLAVKAHYKGSFNDDLVALHNFNGGYCGISKVENNLINICYLTDYHSFKKYRNLEAFQQQVLFKNKYLKTAFENMTMEFEVPLTISQIYFDKKEAVMDHVLMVGDAAGLIHPLCGNGMGMAIHSAKIGAELVINHLIDKRCTRTKMEQEYKRLWQQNFKHRLHMGRFLSAILQKNILSNLITTGLVNFPFLLPQLIKRTHGKPLMTLTDGN